MRCRAPCGPREPLHRDRTRVQDCRAPHPDHPPPRPRARRRRGGVRGAAPRVRAGAGAPDRVRARPHGPPRGRRRGGARGRRLADAPGGARAAPLRRPRPGLAARRARAGARSAPAAAATLDAVDGAARRGRPRAGRRARRRRAPSRAGPGTADELPGPPAGRPTPAGAPLRARPADGARGAAARPARPRARLAPRPRPAPPRSRRSSRARPGAAMRSRPRRRSLYGTVQAGFVHHTVTANDYGPEDSAAIVLGHLPLPPRPQRLERHRLQLPRRPVRPGLRGPRGRRRPGRRRRPGAGLQLGLHGRRLPRRLHRRSSFRPPGLEAIARLLAWKLPLHGAPVSGQITVTSRAATANRYRAGTPVTLRAHLRPPRRRHDRVPGRRPVRASCRRIRDARRGARGPGLGADDRHGRHRAPRPRRAAAQRRRCASPTARRRPPRPLQVAVPAGRGLGLGARRGALHRGRRRLGGDRPGARQRSRAGGRPPATASHGAISAAPLRITVTPQVVVDVAAPHVSARGAASPSRAPSGRRGPRGCS